MSTSIRQWGRSALVFLVFVFAWAPVPSAAEAAGFGEPALVLDLSEHPAERRRPRAFRGRGCRGGADPWFPGFSSPGYLWRTDGTAEGTASIHPDGVRFLDFLPATGGLQWLTATDPGTGALSLWRTDGSAAGTRSLAADLRIGGPFQYHPGLDRLFLSAAPWQPGADPAAADFEPWVSDGTVAGTRRLKDILPTGASRPGSFRPFGDEMAFLATDPAETANSLWLSDGTSAGTRLVKAPVGQSFIDLRVADDRLYLVGRSADQSLFLWSSDGTSAGTVELSAFGRTAPAGSLGVVWSGALDGGRSVWSIETEEIPASLWVSDATAAGTVELMPLALQAGPPTRFLALDGAFYFGADDGTTGQELWRTDGTPAGTEVAFETCPGGCSDFGRLDRVVGARLLVLSGDAAHGLELRTTDGTLEGTELVADLCPGPCSPVILAVHEEDGLGIFLASAASGQSFQVWGTDLTPESTERVTSFSAGSTFGSRFPPARVGDRYLVTGSDGSTAGLWAVAVSGDPAPPGGDWLASPAVPGFSVKVRFSTPSGSLPGALEPECVPETACVSGAIPGRSEVFVRVVGPKPNGYLWPTLVKFSTSQVEVWVRQEASGEVRYYVLEGARPGFDELPGLFDRQGFTP